MKKKLLVAATLLLLSATATFAQMGGIIGGATNGGAPQSLTPPGGYSPTPQTMIYQKGYYVVPNVGETVRSSWGMGGSDAGLKLTSSALVLEKTTMVMSGDDMGAHTNEAWSIPLSGAVKALVFQSDGNLAVLDTNSKVLWSTGTGGRGDHFKYYPDGVLEIFDKAGMSIWRK